jgi:hypothetical protein
MTVLAAVVLGVFAFGRVVEHPYGHYVPFPVRLVVAVALGAAWFWLYLARPAWLRLVRPLWHRGARR